MVTYLELSLAKSLKEAAIGRWCWLTSGVLLIWIHVIAEQELTGLAVDTNDVVADIAVVNEPSVFESLRIYCIYIS